MHYLPYSRGLDDKIMTSCHQRAPVYFYNGIYIHKYDTRETFVRAVIIDQTLPPKTFDTKSGFFSIKNPR